MNRWCYAAYCRNNHSHVTMGHKCGRCGKYGHGDAECFNNHAIQRLYDLYKDDVMPNNKICSVEDCQYNHLHASSAHHCPNCKERVQHTLADCPKDKAPVQQAAAQKLAVYNVKCPICRADNSVSIVNDKKILGLTDECCICASNSVEVLFPTCYHCCVCLACLKQL